MNLQDQVINTLLDEPGLTCYQIHQRILRGSLTGRWFGAWSFLGQLLGPKMWSVNRAILRLERASRIISNWGLSPTQGSRQRRFFIRGYSGKVGFGVPETASAN